MILDSRDLYTSSKVRCLLPWLLCTVVNTSTNSC